MSAEILSSTTRALPTTQSIAQKLAYRMVQVNASSKKILKLFADDALFIFSPDLVFTKNNSLKIFKK